MVINQLVERNYTFDRYMNNNVVVPQQFPSVFSSSGQKVSGNRNTLTIKSTANSLQTKPLSH